MRRVVFFAAVLVAACGGADGGEPGGGERPLLGEPVPALPLLGPGPRGSTTALAAPERLVLRTAAEWESFWARMNAHLQPRPPAPAVDFGRDMLLAAALGRRASGGYGVSIAVARDGAVLRALVTERRPGPGCMTTQALTSPVALVRVPRSEAEVVWSDRVETKDCG